MSRVGKTPISIPTGVTVAVADNNIVTVKGPKGELTQRVDPDITVSMEEGVLKLERPTDSKRHKSLHGLYRALIANMVKGTFEGFTIKQELVGVGYKATVSGNNLDLSLGYSHEILMILPKEVKAEVLVEKGKNPIITLTSHDKQLIGAVAAKIRSLRKPEPYKGKGIKFVGETLIRKAGKSGGKKK